MKFSSHSIEDFISLYIINGDSKKNPIVVHLNSTGIGVDDLAASTCTDRLQMKRYVYESIIPPEKLLRQIDFVFQLPVGTLGNEYQQWQTSLN